MLCGLSQIGSRQGSLSGSRSSETPSAWSFRCGWHPGSRARRSESDGLPRSVRRQWSRGRGEDMSDEGRSVRLTIPAKPEYTTLGRLTLTALAGVRPVSEETLHDLKLALTEACTNSVQHAYRDGRVGTVEILYELEPDRLAVE